MQSHSPYCGARRWIRTNDTTRMKRLPYRLAILALVRVAGIEPTTSRLSVVPSTN